MQAAGGSLPSAAGNQAPRPPALRGHQGAALRRRAGLDRRLFRPGVFLRRGPRLAPVSRLELLSQNAALCEVLPRSGLGEELRRVLVRLLSGWQDASARAFRRGVPLALQLQSIRYSCVKMSSSSLPLSFPFLLLFQFLLLHHLACPPSFFLLAFFFKRRKKIN